MPQSLLLFMPRSFFCFFAGGSATPSSARGRNLEDEPELYRAFGMVRTSFPLQGSFKGDIDIAIDMDTNIDIDKYRYVTIFCKFGVL